MTLPKSVYSPLKVFHHRRTIDALRRGEHPPPVHVQLIITNVCNQSCLHCAYRCEGYSSSETFDPRQTIPFEKCAEIIGDCERMGVRAIEITGGGEPKCHPQFRDVCSTILDAEIDLGLVTNGSFWSSTDVHMLAKAKWIRYSVDAGLEQTYARVRKTKPEAYGKVRDAIRSQTSAPGRAHDQLIGVGFVVTRDNWQEVLIAAEHAKEDGADNFRISAVFQNQGARYFDSFGMEAAKLCREAERLATDKFTVFNLFEDRVSDLRMGQPDYSRCDFQRFCTYVGADLAVYRCCCVAYNHVGLLGSIAEHSFHDFWFSPETERKLEEFDARSCERCMFNARNQTIAYALEQNPLHVNFL